MRQAGVWRKRSGKDILLKPSVGPGGAARRSGVRRLGPNSWLGTLPPGGWGRGALGLSAVRQARGVKARPRGSPISPSLSVVLCEMGMIHASTLSRLSAATQQALAVSLTLTGGPVWFVTTQQGLDSP